MNTPPQNAETAQDMNGGIENSAHVTVQNTPNNPEKNSAAPKQPPKKRFFKPLRKHL